MWPPFFFGAIPTYGVLPYAMIDHANLVDKQFDDTKSSRSDVFRMHPVVLLRCGSSSQSQTKNVDGPYASYSRGGHNSHRLRSHGYDRGQEAVKGSRAVNAN